MLTGNAYSFGKYVNGFNDDDNTSDLTTLMMTDISQMSSHMLLILLFE